MRKSGRRRKAEPSRRYIGIGVSHYKGVFHRIFKYSYSLSSGAIQVGEGGFTTEEAEIWVKIEPTMLFLLSLELALNRCCYPTLDFATAPSQNRISIYKLSLHKKTNIIQKMSKTIRFLYYFQLL